jgi:hypothetical protein
MSYAIRENRPSEHPVEKWGQRSQIRGRDGSSTTLSPQLLTGLALVGLGAFAWYYFGPDLRRYMKIESM